MSLGSELLAAIVRRGERDVFVRLRREYFADAELALFDAIASFFDTFGVLPQEDALASLGLTLPPASAPTAFYLDRLRRRVLFGLVAQSVAEITSAVSRRDEAEVVRLVAALVDQIRPLDLRESPPRVAELVREVIADHAHARRCDTLRGVTFGWPSLDRMTGGARPGDIVTLVGRPGEGKSFALVHMAKAAYLSGKRVLFVSMEMGALQITRRLVAMTVGLDVGLLQQGRLSTFGVQLLHSATEIFADERPFFLLSGDVSGSVADVAQAIAMTAPDIVYVDSSYLLSPRKKTGLRKFEVLEAVCEELKVLALKHHIPIVQTTQFNRAAVKERDNGRGLHNIGYSDAIGQISSVVVSMAPVQGELDSLKREMSVIKNRDGQSGVFYCRLCFSPLSFAEVDAESDHEPDVLDI